MWNVKYDTDELLLNRNRLTDIESKHVVVMSEGRVGDRWIGSLGLADANYYIEWINIKILLCTTGNYIQYPVINHDGREYEKECIYICITESLCCTVEINT